MELNLETLATSLGKASRSGQGWVCCCPSHDDQHPSLSMSLGDHHQLLLYCHSGCSFEQVLKALQDKGLIPSRSHSRTPHQHACHEPSEDHTASRWHLSYIRTLWHEAIPVEGTLAHLYLRTRLDNHLQEIPPTLRYLPSAKHSPTGKGLPCLIAAVTVYPYRHVTAIHRTFLRQDGKGKASIYNPKMMLGRVRGGAVRLAPATEDLMIAEGIETSLTLQVMLRKPVWAALSSHNMAHVVVPPLPLAQNLYIAQDNDAGGRKGALALAEKAWAEGRKVRILQPPYRLNDFNDLLFYGDQDDLTR